MNKPMYFPEDLERLRDGMPEPTPEEQAYQDARTSTIVRLQGLDAATLQKRLKRFNSRLQQLQKTPNADQMALYITRGYRDATAQCLILKSEPTRPVIATKQGGLSLPLISALVRRIRR